MNNARLFQHRNAYSRLLLIFLLCLLPFTLMRLLLYLLNQHDFRSLGALEVLAAFAVGLKFDASMVAMVAGIPLLLMLPFRWSMHVYWQRLWAWIIFCSLLLMSFMMAVDTVYFGKVHRHVGAEINTIQTEMPSLSMLALSQYRAALALFCVAAIASAFFWRYLTHHVPPLSGRLWLRASSLLAGLLLLSLLGRGGIGGKPLSVGEAFFSNSPAQGYLVLNGAFAVSRALGAIAPPPREFMPQAEALARTRDFLAGGNAPYAEPGYPLYRHFAARSRRDKPNVVVLMLESWSAIHIDALREQRKLPPLGVTPNFDRLAKQGRLYTKFYANGQHSIQGGAAILAGLPTLPGMPFLGEGLEQNRQRFLGELAQAEGYATFFLQSSDRGSLRFDAIAARAGFASYLGNEDMPELHAHKKPGSAWGTWDHNTFQQANRLFAAAHKPFLGFVFSSSTHIPWLIPDRRWQKYRGGKDLDNALNALYYADWALGEFVAAAKQSGYFEHTIFVLVADHASEFAEDAEDVPSLFHIPLLLLGPGIAPAIDQRIGSQFDLIPSIAELAGWRTGYSGLGRSLLDDARVEERAALCVRDNALSWINARGWLSHNLQRRVGSSARLTPTERDEMEKNLLAVYQLATRLQLDNRIAPPGVDLATK